MTGFIFSVIAGAAMSVQGVFNTGLNENIGLLESNAFVQGTAFVLSLIAMFAFGNGDIKAVSQVNKLFLTGGILGFVITLCVIMGIRNLNPTVATSAILIAQLLASATIEAFGLFGVERVPFHW
ncbi:MAG: DMT family transporter, partial [Clostridia bacterium]|nr:DMT family transporter [Clostridia bacterium]